MSQHTHCDVFPLISARDVAQLADWLVHTLGFEESWRETGASQVIEHAELILREIHGSEVFGGRVSINLSKAGSTAVGPASVALRVAHADTVSLLAERVQKTGAQIIQGPEESRVAFSFTVLDPEGNQWWVHAETGMLGELRRIPL